MAGRASHAPKSKILKHKDKIIPIRKVCNIAVGKPLVGCRESSQCLRTGERRTIHDANARHIQTVEDLIKKWRIATRAPGYVLRIARNELDLYDFERLVSEADKAEPAEAAAKLREALGLWRGAPLDDLSDRSFAQAAIRRLEELRLAAIEKRIEADYVVHQWDYEARDD